MSVLTETTTRRGLRVATKGLVHIYRAEGHDVAALSGVDLVVDPGEVVGLLGPSGAGKSTLLTLFGGLMRPSAGRVRGSGSTLDGRQRTEADQLSRIFFATCLTLSTSSFG